MRFNLTLWRWRRLWRGGFSTAVALIPIYTAACARLEPTPERAGLANRAQTRPAVASGPVNTNADKLALEGYDPVSYFNGAGPVKGSPRITATDRGATYCFASEANRALFVARPQRYEPAYGGFCAAGVAHGYKVACDPTDYKVDDGKLYLFNRNLLFDASQGWTPQQKREADVNWERATGG